jgi:hypothetical protein
MTDFLSRESDILGGEFSSSGGLPPGGDIDFDRAASAFPDISIDGPDDFHIPAQAPPSVNRNASSTFSFDDFGSPLRERETVVKVTGDDEIEKFENEFPDIDVGQVSISFVFDSDGWLWGECKDVVVNKERTVSEKKHRVLCMDILPHHARSRPSWTGLCPLLSNTSQLYTPLPNSSTSYGLFRVSLF